MVTSVIEAHGGLERYSQLSSITVKFDFTGVLLQLKNQPHHLVVTAVVSTKEQKVTYVGLGGAADEEWVFTPKRVYKTKNGQVLSSLDNPRDSFAEYKLETPWSDLQFLYFCGYALWQYFNFPYYLAREDVSAREVAAHSEAGATWRVLEVTFPDANSFASHSQVQKFYFNDSFQLQRHDYAPEIIASSPAVHYSYDPITVNGMTFPSLRRVVAAGVGPDGVYLPVSHGPTPTLIHLVFFKVQLNRQDAKTASLEDVWALNEAPSA